MEDLFDELGDAGIERSSLYLAWDFTVASERNLTERALAIRDDAFGGQLGDDRPRRPAPSRATRRSSRINPAVSPTSRRPRTRRIARRVEGTAHRPLLPGRARVPARLAVLVPAGLDRSRPGIPLNTATAELRLRDPALGDRRSARSRRSPSLYGHGLLGSASEVDRRQHPGDGARAQLHLLRDRLGRVRDARTSAPSCSSSRTSPSSRARRPHAAGLRQLHVPGPGDDPPGRASARRRLPGRGGRQRDRHRPRLFYDGNSQGGIMGGALTALAPDFNRAVLGVPGDELLDPAAPQRRLRALRGGPVRRDRRGRDLQQPPEPSPSSRTSSRTH